MSEHAPTDGHDPATEREHALPSSGPDPNPMHPPGSGRAVVVLGLVLVAVGLWSWNPQPAGVWHDDGVYVLIGETLAQGGGLAYGGVVGEPPAPKFPPVYSAVVALAYTLGGDVATAVLFASGLNVLIMALAGAAFALFCRRGLGLSPGWALAWTGVTWLSVDLWRVSVLPLSEPLFVLVLVASLLVCGRSPGGRRDRSGDPVSTPGREGGFVEPAPWVLVVASFALITHIRSIGVAFGAAAVAAAVVSRRPRRAAGLLLAFGTVLLPWTLWSARATRRMPEGLADVLGSYGSFARARAVAGGLELVAALPSRALGLADWCLAVLLPGVPSGVRWALGVALVPVLLLGLVELCRRNRLAGFTVVFLLGALWLWPFVDRRLMAPLVPWLAVCLLLGGAAAGGGAAPPGPAGWRSLRAAPGMLAGLWAPWFAVTSVVGLQRGWHDAAYRIRAPAVIQAAEAVARTTDADEVVGAPELWAAIHLYTGRTVAPSAPFRPGDPDVPVWGTPAEQVRLWMDTGLDLVLAEHGGAVHGPTLDHIRAVCGPQALEVAADYPGARLVRLRWDATCRDQLRGGR